jgi:hypothetical protein
MSRPFGHALGVFLLAALVGLALAFLLAAFAASAAHASPTSSAGAGQYAVAITTVTTLTVPQFAASAEICVETAAARYTTTGTTPTAAIGIPVAAGQCFQLNGPFAAFQIVGSGATIDIEYFK